MIVCVNLEREYVGTNAIFGKKHAHEIHFYAKIPLKSEFFCSIFMKKHKNDGPGIRHVFT